MLCCVLRFLSEVGVDDVLTRVRGRRQRDQVLHSGATRPCSDVRVRLDFGSISRSRTKVMT